MHRSVQLGRRLRRVVGCLRGIYEADDSEADKVNDEDETDSDDEEEVAVDDENQEVNEEDEA